MPPFLAPEPERASATAEQIPRTPIPDESTALVDFFTNNFADSGDVQNRSNLFWIPRNFDLFLKDDQVKLSAQCVGAMAIARLHRSPQYTREAELRYCLALESVSKQIHTKTTPENGASYMAVLWLGFFEILSSSGHASRQAWRTHLGGLASLFLQSEGGIAKTRFGTPMFRQTRSQIVIHALQSCTPVLAGLENQTRYPPMANPISIHYDEAETLLIHLANLQAKCHESTPSHHLSSLLALEERLIAWTRSGPPLFTYTALSSGRQSELWWDNRLDVYSSGFVAHAWNKVRAARIITNDLLRKAQETEPHENDGIWSSQASTTGHELFRELVIDLCATLPVYYRPAFPGTKHELYDNAPPMGTVFWYLWPLEVAGTSAQASPQLTSWIAQTLDRIYETTGIHKACLVAERLRTGDRRPLLP